MELHFKKSIARMVGNFGVSFFSPLVGTNAAELVFNVGFTMEMAVIIAFFSALFITGLSISKEAVEWGKNGKEKTK